LGTIQPSQGDYFQAVKGGGHGDYRLIVLAPNSVQEMVDHTVMAFDLADKWRNPVLILTDGAIGQMMEKIELPDPYPLRSAEDMRDEKPWATNGRKGGVKKNLLTSLNIKSDEMERKNNELQAKYGKIENEEVRYESYNLDDADIVISAYGLSSRICKKVVDLGREQGLKIGLLRPITLWPFPSKKLDELAAKKNVKMFMTIEMSVGQMVEDVRLVVNGRKPVYFYGRTGGILATAEEILDQIKMKM
ncbi:MAG TPA: 3-methyl-2-oxobutanoate dehydrogenase subunit VorB, partial [bacterium]|nr:3-methyl-2-oxobutanoate dehydrogenase subunit VorB [bacterium]